MLLKLAWRNIWRNKKRSFITVTAIVVAVFLSISMRSLQLGMYDSMINTIVGSFTGYIQLHTKGYWDEQIVDNAFESNEALQTKINEVYGVKNTVKRIQCGSLAANDDLSKFVFISGIEPKKEMELTDWNKRLVEGELLTAESRSINIGKGLASFFEAGIGDTLIFIGQGYHGMQAVGAYPVSGIVDLKSPRLNSNNVFMSLAMAQEFLSAQNMITHLIVNIKEYEDEKEIASAIQEKAGDEYEVMSWQEMLPELEQTIQADSAGGLIMVFILYMIITFGIFGTVLMMTEERKYEFGVVISIGMKRLKLITTMIFETIILSSLGVIAGVVLSRPLILYFYYNPLEFTGDAAAAFENFGFEPLIPFMSTYDIPMTHGLIIFTISVIISLYPSFIIWNLNPVKAMKR